MISVRTLTVFIIAFLIITVSFSDAMASNCHDTKADSDVVIDVRTPEEYQSGHIEGAININYTGIGSEIEKFVPDKNTVIHLYCGSGRRAGIAKDTLEEMGYTNVINEGGFEDYSRKLNKQ